MTMLCVGESQPLNQRRLSRIWRIARFELLQSLFQLRLAILFTNGLDSLRSQLITALVFRLSGMSLYPMPADLMAGDCLIEHPPQVGVFYWFLGLGFPAVPLPPVHPGSDAILYVVGVGVKHHLAWTVERIEPFDRRLKLHPVVGSSR